MSEHLLWEFKTFILQNNLNLEKETTQLKIVYLQVWAQSIRKTWNVNIRVVSSKEETYNLFSTLKGGSGPR